MEGKVEEKESKRHENQDNIANDTKELLEEKIEELENEDEDNDSSEGEDGDKEDDERKDDKSKKKKQKPNSRKENKETKAKKTKAKKEHLHHGINKNSKDCQTGAEKPFTSEECHRAKEAGENIGTWIDQKYQEVVNNPLFSPKGS